MSLKELSFTVYPISTFICALAVIAGAPAHAADDPNVPRPGLYRVEQSASTKTAQTEVKSKTEGKSGSQTITTSAGGRTHTAAYAGNKPVEICVRAGNSGPPEWAKCKVELPVRKGDVTISKSDCQGIKTSVAMKRIGTDVYEQRTHIERPAMPAGGGPSREMYEAMIAQAPKEQQAEMRKGIDQMFSPEAKAQREQAMKALPAHMRQQATTAVAYVDDVVNTMTRIGDCK